MWRAPPPLVDAVKLNRARPRRAAMPIRSCERAAARDRPRDGDVAAAGERARSGSRGNAGAGNPGIGPPSAPQATRNRRRGSRGRAAAARRSAGPFAGLEHDPFLLESDRALDSLHWSHFPTANRVHFAENAPADLEAAGRVARRRSCVDIRP